MSTPATGPEARGGSAAAASPVAEQVADGLALGPTYRARLRLEGSVLAACGLIGSIVLVLADERTTANGLSTVLQLLVVAALLVWFGPRSVHRAVAQALPAGEVQPTGEPTPLWQLPLIVAALVTPFLLFGAWDAGLRVTGGCLLVGLAQAILLERVVARHEDEQGRRFVRAPGSRLFRGTQLAWALEAASGGRSHPAAQSRD